LDFKDMGGDDNGGMPDHTCVAPRFDGALRLSDWGVIRAEGPDAASFLHGQLTQDVTHLDASHARLAGYCSAKGRLLATFIVWRPAPEQILLACSADLLPATLKRLSMFVLRAKCKLSDARGEIVLHGLAGASAQAWLGSDAPPDPWALRMKGSAQIIRLPDADSTPRWIAAGPAEAPPLPEIDASLWGWLEVRSGVPRVTAATSEQFVPQMLNLELLGGVDFKKGCYPGQEVVARSQYRGTLKRRTYLLDSDEALSAGTEVFHSDDPSQPAGMVVLTASRPDGQHAALVELKIAAIEGGGLHAARSDGPRLSVQPLPYPLDAEVV
jgi:folate-binding protein YgfZ